MSGALGQGTNASAPPDDYYMEQAEIAAGQGYRAMPEPAPNQALPTTIGSQPQQFGANFDPGDASQPQDDSAYTEDYAGGTSTEGGHSGLRAFGDEVWAGTLGMGQAALGAAKYAADKLGADPQIAAVIDRSKQALQQHIEDTIGGLSDEAQASLKSSLFDPDAPSPGRDVSWKSYIGATVAGLVPQAALAVLPGGLVGKAVTKVLGGVLTEGAAAAAGTAARVGTTAGSFGTLDMGEAYNSLVDEIDNAKEDELNQSDVYKHLRDTGASDADARKQLIAAIAPTFAAEHFAAGAISGGLLGEGLAAGVPGAAERSALARFGIGAAEGAATMGGQAAADEGINQSAQQQAGLRQGYDPGAIAEAGAGGALGGAILGAGAGVFRTHGKTPEIENPAQVDQEPVTPAASAALKTALGLPEDATQGSLDLPPTPQQGDLLGRNPQGPPPAPAPAEPAPGQAVPGQTTLFGDNPTANRQPGQGDIFAQPQPSAPEQPPLALPGPSRPPSTINVPATGRAQIDQGPPPGIDVNSRTQINKPPGGGPPGAPEAPTAQVAAGPTSTPKSPTPAAESKPAGPTSRAELIAAIKDLSPSPPKGLAAMKIADLRDMHGDLLAQFASGEKPGAANTTVVKPEPAPGGDGTPVERGPSAEAIAAAAGPAGQGATPVGGTPERTPAPSETTEPTEPTEAQKAAGNYRKERVKVGGLDLSIENKAGSIRSGTGADGNPWSVKMPADYGYIRGTTGADGDHVDVYVKPGSAEGAAGKPVYVVDQKDPATGKFDEHKAMIGFDSKQDAIATYHNGFSDGSGPKRMGAITEMPFDEFKQWTQSGDTKKPIALPLSKVEQLKAQAAAKRAQQKAKMQAAVARVKGEAYVSPGEAAEPVGTAATSSDKSSTRADAMKQMRDALPSVIKNATLRKGIAEAGAMRDVMREIENLLADNKHDDTDQSVHDAIRQYGKTAATAAGTTTRKADIAAALLRKMDVETAPRAEGLRDAMAEDIARESVEPKAAIEEHHTEVEPAEETAADALTEGEEGAEAKADDTPSSARVENAGSKEQHARELLDDLHNGSKTPREAHEAYGVQVGGRPRKFPTFADFLEHQANEADSEENKKALIEKMVAAQKLPTKAERAAATNEINHLMERTGPEYAAKLRDWAAEIRDPLRIAADNDRLAMREKMRAQIAERAKPKQVEPKQVEPKRVKPRDPELDKAMTPDEFDARLNKVLAPAKTLARVFLDKPKAKEYVEFSREKKDKTAQIMPGNLIDIGRSVGLTEPELESLTKRLNPLADKSLIPPEHQPAIERTLDKAKTLRAKLDRVYAELLAKHGLSEKDEGRLAEAASRLADKNYEAYKLAFSDEATRRTLFRKNNPASLRFINAVNDREFNSSIPRVLRGSENMGVPTSLHVLLRTIRDKAVLSDDLKPLAALADVLLKVAPDVAVRTHEEAFDRGLIDRGEHAAFADGRLGGAYFTPENGQPGHIVMGPHNESHVVTLLHEALHTVTSDFLENIAEDHPARQALDAIRREVAMHAKADGFSLDNYSNLGHAINYALSNAHELHTMLMSEPALNAWLAGKRASPELRAELAKLGYHTPESSSVWRTFTTWLRRAVGLSPVASATEHSVLDHILRPLTDITDQAAEYNKRMAVYPDVAARAAPLFREAMPSLRDRGGRIVGEALDKLKPGDRVRGALLTAMPLDHMVDRYNKLFTSADHGKPLEAFRAAQEKIQHIANDFRRRYDNRYQAISKRLEGPDGDVLGKLTRDATLADVQLGPGADNSHVKDQDTLKTLQDRYEALSPQAKQTYIGLRDYYRSVNKETRAARFDAMIAKALPDATDAQKQMLRDIAGSRKKVDEFLKNDDAKLAASYGDQWEATKKKLVRGLMKVHRLGFVRGDYFPLRRFGDYVIRYGDKNTGDGYGVEMFERKGDALARHAELKAQNTAGLTDVMLKRASNLSEIVPDHPAVDELFNAMRSNDALKDNAEAVRDMLQSTLMEHASRSEAARTALRRKSVLGASDDASRILAREHLSNGTTLGQLQGGVDRARALEQMGYVAHDLETQRHDGSGIIARQVLNEVQKRLAAGDDAEAMSAAGALRKATTLGFVQSLMSPSHMLTSSIETHTNASALMGARHGLGRTTAMLGKALSDVSPTLYAQGARNTLKAMQRGLKASDWNLAHAARDRLIAKGANAEHMNALFGALDEAGLIDHSSIREMQRIASPGGYAGKGMGEAWQRFMDLNAAGAHAVDVANKSAVAKAAFDLEFRRTKDLDGSVRYATDTVRRASPNYNLSNKSRISTTAGPLRAFAAPLTQFKQYGLHMYSLMANLAQASMHGATAAERKEARKAFAGILATHALMAGALTLVADPLRYVGGAYDALFTDATKPHDYENDVRGFLADTFGPELGEVISRGLPHLAGIDIHNRVGLANLLEIPELDDFTSKGWLMALGKAMTGAAGEDAANIAAGAVKIRQGDVLGGLQDVIPRVFRDPLKASNLATQGIVSKGKVVLPADQIGAGAVLAQGLGFQPAQVSEFREGRAAVQEAQQEVQRERTSLTTAWVNANPSDRAAIMSQIRQFNAEGKGNPITLDALYKQLASKQAAARQQAKTVFGLKVQPTATSIIRSGSFANY